jgi:hypothetical protein
MAVLGRKLAAATFTARTAAKIRGGPKTVRRRAGRGDQGGARTCTEEGNGGDADFVDDVSDSVVFALSGIDRHAVADGIIGSVVLVADIIISSLVLVVAVMFALVLQGQLVVGNGGHKHRDIGLKGDRVGQWRV